MANTPVNLEEFLQWYKKSEVILWEKKWVFREPKMKDIWKLSLMQMLEEYCIEWERSEFKEIIDNDLPVTQHKVLIEKILNDLGLAWVPLEMM